MMRWRRIGLGQRLDVLDRRVIPAVHQRARLGAEDQGLRGARAGAPPTHFVDELGRLRPAGRARDASASRTA